jgi:type IV pilus assembly protein PilO
MTNLSGEFRQIRFKWLSPERAVLVLPVMASLAMAALIVPAGIWPISERMNNQQEEVELLRSKSIVVPQLRQQLVDLSVRQRLREQQLDRLLALVAGTSELNTFLAELNDLGYANGVLITTTEPGDVEVFVPQTPPVGMSDGAPPAAGGEDALAPSGDVLLKKGLEKRSAEIAVQGAFVQVYEFLRALERLQVFVIVSEMDIQSEVQSRSENDEVSLPRISMFLKLTAYGRQTGSSAPVINKNPESTPKETAQPLYPSL